MKAEKQFENLCGIQLSKRKHLELLALLLCLEIVLAFSYLGYIQIPPISVTTLHILVIVAAMFFGPWDAAAVALVFALTSIWKASVTSVELGDVIFSPFLSGKPLESIIMAAGTRLLFAIVTGYAFRFFFSRPRRHPAVGVTVLSVLSACLHALLVYWCMAAFFGAAEQETTAEFDRTLIFNNLLMYAVTVAVVLGFYKLVRSPGIAHFFEKMSLEETETEGRKSKAVRLVYVLLAMCSVFIVIHFISRFTLYLKMNSEEVSESYLSWTYALIVQLIAGFAGVFGIITLFVRWTHKYYSALAMEANIRARENAEIANRSKSMFLFSMSHDIRTPMNAILGYTDIALRHKNDPERVDDSLMKIKTSGAHLLALINDILEMSRIESGTLELTESPVDIREIVSNVDFMSRALAAPKSIDYETQVGEFTTPYVLTDELHVNEVLINLISNAVKYTPEGGRVRYRIEQAGPVCDGIARFLFEVSDTGIGMSEAFQEHLFEAFSRENQAFVSKTEGAGLGLSIVKRIVDLAGGTIRVKSTPGSGSVFTVELPMKVMSEAEEQAYRALQRNNTDIEADAHFAGKKVLLVEDNEMNREIATEILEEAGLTIESAEDGAIAVDAVRKNGADHYDFILMDIQMPVMNGYEATREIRKLKGGDRIPIIALSANAFKEDKERSLESGMNAHVAKPIDVKTLLSVMHALSR